MVSAHSNTQKTFFINAKIYDGENFLDNDTLIVQDTHFLALENYKNIKNLIDKNDAVIDLLGARVLPGFIEAHGHLISLGQSLSTLDLRKLTPEEIALCVKEQSKKQYAGTWIKGRGWDQNLWPSKQFPDSKMLKIVSPKNPVYLRRVDGHAVWLNDSALILAGINKNTPDPEGGIIVRDRDHNPTGILIDRAIDLVNHIANQLGPKELKEYFDRAAKHAVSMGITSFHDAGTDEKALELFIKEAKDRTIPLRIYAMLDGDDQKLVDKYLSSGPQQFADSLSIRSIKYFADGALGSRGALLIDEYHDQKGSKGLALIDEDTLANNTAKAIKAGFQIATHAIGDQANRMVLNAYERATKTSLNHDLRLRIEHAQLIDPRDHARFKELSVIASMQPIHCTSDMPWIPSRIGFDRLKGRAYPWRSLLRHDVKIAFGSDSPVEPINPILGLYAAVSRASIDDGKEFMPEERLSMKEALRAYFSDAAYAEFSEHKKGKIAPQFLADFVVFSDDILHLPKRAFLAAKPVMTVVGGKIVYQK